MSSKTAKAYQRLASILAHMFQGRTAEVSKPVALPEPGSPWPERPPPQFPTPWATHWGQDPFGLWCGFSLGGLLQRMRWIPPGEFQMGSPEDEPERGDNEARHRVTLTRGLWLAETACTQGLWREVMGKNPSHFEGADLPVEDVSWDDVQAFCKRLEERLPGLEARLPSEVEWEYACRAGTQGPFWWGDVLSTELANYDGNYPYNDGPKGEYRQETVPARCFDPNPWGLYQVHGNVWEWCEDRYGEYPTEDGVDPTGPERGSLRVIRGGGWDYFGGRLRAADRDHDQPAGRNGALGFRLAAGPRPGGAGGARRGRGHGGGRERERTPRPWQRPLRAALMIWASVHSGPHAT